MLECVGKFCYLGDMIGSGGGAEEASRARVQCAWGKFRKLAPILTSTRGIPNGERKGIHCTVHVFSVL